LAEKVAAQLHLDLLVVKNVATFEFRAHSFGSIQKLLSFTGLQVRSDNLNHRFGQGVKKKGLALFVGSVDLQKCD
jgi:hypothetical protein